MWLGRIRSHPARPCRGESISWKPGGRRHVVVAVAIGTRLAPYSLLLRLPRPRWTQWGDPQSATGSRTACTRVGVYNTRRMQSGVRAALWGTDLRTSVFFSFSFFFFFRSLSCARARARRRGLRIAERKEKRGNEGERNNNKKKEEKRNIISGKRRKEEREDIYIYIYIYIYICGGASQSIATR